jgi:DNA invertase Pin-like site-specific DNA recombinase
MRLRCAAYARYSSDRQSPASIEDQLRNCHQKADKEGWEFLEDQVYTDRELSGAGADRPGFVRMLQAIKQSPRPFDVLLVDDTSRLTRNRGDLEKLVEELVFNEIRLVAVAQGIDTQDEQSGVLMSVHGIFDSLYIKELAAKTRRGLVGRALKGLNTGGRCYGYDNIPAPEIIGAEGAPAVRRQINEQEAVVIRRIFQMYAEGLSLKAITKLLNAEHVPPPRKRKEQTVCYVVSKCDPGNAET